MKNKVIALVGCIAATAPTISIADVLPENLVGLNLGEIRSNSFLNQPFKGVIPLLFTSFDNSKNLNVKLASESIFKKIGAEKYPILNSLNFQITQQNNKPVILISSNQPIQLPFLNFVLEIQGPEGSVFQDYTVLLDPETKPVASSPEADYIVFNQPEVAESIVAESIEPVVLNPEEVLRATLLLANLSSKKLYSKTASSRTISQSLKYTVRAGDSLSKIVQLNNTNNFSVETMNRLILQKNPNAFISGDVNRIKKGARLNLPTASEINSFELAVENKSKALTSEPNKVVKEVIKELNENSKSIKKSSRSIKQTIYTVVKGDSLFKITKKFASNDISLTKMMNTIYSNNPEAFVNNNKNKIKAGAELSIPVVVSVAKGIMASKQKLAFQQTTVEKPVSDSSTMVSNEAENLSTQNKKVESVSLKADEYQILKGDTLSSITTNIGHQEVPFAKMLKAIYVENPSAFIDGNMTKLSVGSVIKLPSISSFNISAEEASQVSKVKKVTQAKKVKSTIAVASINKSIPSTDLIRRIRELRKELKQNKDSLSEMKNRLNQKEILLQQKNNQLDSLKVTLTKLNENVEPELMLTAAVAGKQAMSVVEKTNVPKQMTDAVKPVSKDTYRPKSKAEIAKLKRELLLRQEKTNKQIDKIKELKSKTMSANELALNSENQGLFKKYAESEILNFTKSNYSYLTIALLLSLLLVRYRRELYRYTYSAIRYDQPTYYPVPDADKYELKEKNINYHDKKMDQDAIANYESLSVERTPEVIESKLVINPLLVEATEEIFDTTKDQKHIEHCEHLVTELFDDLNASEDPKDNSEWQDIEKVCDTYIEKIKDADSAMAAKENGALVEEAADFNHMMSDLLESLEKVDESVKRNNISDDTFPDLIRSSTHADFEKDKQQARFNLKNQNQVS